MNKSFIKYLAALLLFGSNGIIAGNIDMSSYEIVFLRTLIGSVLLIALFLITGNKFTFYRHKKDCFFLGVSGIAMGASWILLYEAYQQIGVSLASLLYYCGPVIVMALSPLLFKERLTAAKLVGFAAVIVGVILVNGDVLGEGSGGWGVLCAALSAVTYSLMVIFNKLNKNVTGLENSTLQLTVSFLTVAVFLLCRQGFTLSVLTEDWLWIIILGLLNTGVGCYFYFSSIGELNVQTVAVCGYLEPLSAVVFSVIFLSERMLPLQIVGAVLIIGGAIVGECVKPKSSTEKG